MPRRPPRPARAAATDRRGLPALSSLLLSVCPGPPRCDEVHSYLFVDGLDLIGRTYAGARGVPPARLLRPGGPLYPADQPRTATIATPPHSDAPLSVRIRLRGGTVVWSELMYPDADGRPVEEVRFELAQYLAEIERGYRLWGSGR